MPFHKHRATLESLRNMLDEIRNPTPEQKMLRTGLACLIENPRSYACVNTNNPFVKEFFAAVPEADNSHESCFSVFECLAIIFREKALRDPQSMLKEEKAVLEYFENSGNWSQEEPTIATTWYWDRLPLQVLREGGSPPWH